MISLMSAATRMACRQMIPQHLNALHASVERASGQRVRQRCPVTAPCLRWAPDLGQVSGIWGGTTEEERRALRRTPVPR
jgi:hypothetical protein